MGTLDRYTEKELMRRSRLLSQTINHYKKTTGNESYISWCEGAKDVIRELLKEVRK